jgi:hypothetical protein
MNTCELCGFTGKAREVRPGITFNPDPIFPGRWYEVVPRCVSRSACAIRVARQDALRACASEQEAPRPPRKSMTA